MSNLPWKRPVHSDFFGRDPFSMFDRMMTNFFEGTPTAAWPKALAKDPAAAGFLPPIDMRETESDIAITAELPGLDEKDVQITLDQDSVTIRGEKRFEKTNNTKDRQYIERSYGSFQRTLPLPCEVDRERTAASFKKGVLEIHLPKSTTAKAQARQVPIKSAD